MCGTSVHADDDDLHTANLFVANPLSHLLACTTTSLYMLYIYIHSEHATRAHQSNYPCAKVCVLQLAGLRVCVWSQKYIYFNLPRGRRRSCECRAHNISCGYLRNNATQGGAGGMGVVVEVAYTVCTKGCVIHLLFSVCFLVWSRVL